MARWERQEALAVEIEDIGRALCKGWDEVDSSHVHMLWELSQSFDGDREREGDGGFCVFLPLSRFPYTMAFTWATEWFIQQNFFTPNSELYFASFLFRFSRLPCMWTAFPVSAQAPSHQQLVSPLTEGASNRSPALSKLVHWRDVETRCWHVALRSSTPTAADDLHQRLPMYIARDQTYRLSQKVHPRLRIYRSNNSKGESTRPYCFSSIIVDETINCIDNRWRYFPTNPQRYKWLSNSSSTLRTLRAWALRTSIHRGNLMNSFYSWFSGHSNIIAQELHCSCASST